MTNLANNALTYGTRERPVTITTAVSGDDLELAVHNEGPPIPEPLMAQIFEPMRRGEGKGKLGSRSVGLGLYIVREIAAAHGGRVAVRSNELEGTTFIVTLPARGSGKVTAGAPWRRGAAGRAARGGGRRTRGAAPGGRRLRLRRGGSARRARGSRPRARAHPRADASARSPTRPGGRRPAARGESPRPGRRVGSPKAFVDGKKMQILQVRLGQLT